MNDPQYQSKITDEHRTRKALVYLRQSSPKQVVENLESQRLQYAMARSDLVQIVPLQNYSWCS